MTTERFNAVDFSRQHPAADVADHEVLMSFTGDSDAVAFRDWWDAQGAQVFGTWLEWNRNPNVVRAPQ